jgi:catechol 2,3-dioxygenase-like lactoylglutathione lyase family enzyme
MIDHLGIVFRSLEAAGEFYRAVLPPIGMKQVWQVIEPDGSGRLIFANGEHEAPFFVVAAGRPSFWNEDSRAGAAPAHIAFKAPSRAAVDAFHAAGLAQGAKDNGAPGVRRGRYYCAFLIDPDGNNVEAGVYADE